MTRLKYSSIKNARELSVHILIDIFSQESFANLAIDNYLAESSLEKRDRAFVTQIVYGVIRHHNTLEWLINHLVGKKAAKIKPIIKSILLVGLYQIIYLDKVPDSAACNESSKLAGKYGHKGVVGFVNGVLRNAARQKEQLPYPDITVDPIEHIVLKYSHPSWMVQRWIDRFGIEGTIQLCQKNNEPAKVWLRCNTLKIQMEQFVHSLQASEIQVKKSVYAPEGICVENIDKVANIPGFREGHFIVQDESSMVVGHIMGVIAGSKVIDACSAPGGKTTHIAQLMENKGQIKAFDVHEHKINLVKTNCQRLGINIVDIDREDAKNLGDKLPCWADYVLADVPCSGMGVLGRRADARWRKTPQQLRDLPQLQREILSSVSQCVKVGGVLVYSTCSIEPEENIEVVKSFLANHSNFQLDDLAPYLPFSHKEAYKGYFQFLPHIHGTDGFFVARMKRMK